MKKKNQIKIEGTVVQVLPVTFTTNENTPRQQILLKMDSGIYSNKIVFAVWGKKVDTLREGDFIEAHLNIQAAPTKKNPNVFVNNMTCYHYELLSEKNFNH